MMESQNVVATEPRRAQQDLEFRLRPEVEIYGPDPVGEVLVRLGYISDRTRQKILTIQKKSGKQFGAIALKLGVIDVEQLNIGLAVRYGYLEPTDGRVKVPANLTLIRRPSSAASEEIRKLRTLLLTEHTPEELSLFSIVPAGPNVHAEFLAANLAASFAVLQRRVLIIDTDLRRSRIGKFFEMPRREGLFDVLSGDAIFHETLTESPVVNLSLLTAGLPKHNSQQLIAGIQLNDVLLQAKAMFDIVIVLTASSGREADSHFVWASTKRALVATRRDVTRHHELRHVRGVFRQLNVDVIGAAMMR